MVNHSHCEFYGDGLDPRLSTIVTVEQNLHMLSMVRCKQASEKLDIRNVWTAKIFEPKN